MRNFQSIGIRLASLSLWSCCPFSKFLTFTFCRICRLHPHLRGQVFEAWVLCPNNCLASETLDLPGPIRVQLLPSHHPLARFWLKFLPKIVSSLRHSWRRRVCKGESSGWTLARVPISKTSQAIHRTMENTHGNKNLINDKCKNVVQYCVGCLPAKEPRRHDLYLTRQCYYYVGDYLFIFLVLVWKWGQNVML
jgi:hypothetical protein